MTLRKLALTLLLGTSLTATAQADDLDRPRIRHVLLISIDGMHSVDFINCVTGLPGVNGGMPYCPTLAKLKRSGLDYLDAQTSRPSDSFPGLMAIVSGGTPRTVGAFYDVAYDRVLQPPAKTTGNGVAGGSCVPNQVPTGTTTEYEEGIDLDKSRLDGGADSGIASIDSMRLPRDPAHNCNPVFPWNFVRTNTIFGVAHRAGLRTAWFDKHPAYAAVSGPGDGTNLDDFYSPEINSPSVNLPGVKTSTGVDCTKLPDQSALMAGGDYTTSFANIQCYDQLKVNGILALIDGLTHDRMKPARTPNLFGMNFQAVSVGQKLIETTLNLKGGYLDSFGTPSVPLLGEIRYVDSAIGSMVADLKARGFYDDTLIVITAKHGQSPVDSPRYTGITKTGPVTTSPATILDGAGCLPSSESPSNPTGIGPTEDDVSLIWLNASCTTAQAVKLLETTSPASNNIAGIGEIMAGRQLAQLFGAPGLPPQNDPRTPDIVVTPNIGVTYSGSTKKQAEHGGFAHDDTNVIMLLSNPKLPALTIGTPVQTAQVAPSILKVLGLDPDALESVRIEGTEVLPLIGGIFSDRDRDR
ncbi:MAG: alkaline phosphatase family protein [Methylobacteriaceae bacterium]|nr:alkaline phosphatase family protein [Methylobacteriaceae bacterium]MBV9245628.1 alkaline phosphatase family protein [Methylobacteriaceae bacterium]